MLRPRKGLGKHILKHTHTHTFSRAGVAGKGVEWNGRGVVVLWVIFTSKFHTAWPEPGQIWVESEVLSAPSGFLLT